VQAAIRSARAERAPLSSGSHLPGALGSRRYQLGQALVPLGDHAAAGMGISQLAMPTLRQLTAETGLTSRLAIMDDGYAVSVVRLEAPGIFRMVPLPGLRELPHCSAFRMTDTLASLTMFFAT